MPGPEKIYAWRYTGSHHEGQWNRSKVSHSEQEYTRSDIAEAAEIAAWNAAIEAAAEVLGLHESTPCRPTEASSDERYDAYVIAGQIDAASSWQGAIRALKKDTQ